ncbi:hypothetical protein QWY75_12985 [Pontixanthobacter aestiaquae]|uniref:Uncharacterized protein n=1 Tax=Pontixanthobacter aestiaquae TaxID=1509367 RepID=A0A844Z334_9SPHN|nr:hypothetical protein [Pontixanthobacter aestiaquae]MDN3647120.1 hypothetical protein [Pontixanthobacter aestiaquae]MXO81904.1 hypothetical protein [Pontixanthobacter aestiaquae]
MNKALNKTAAQTKDWRKSISDHVAYALLVYTAIHIFATVGAMKATGLKTGALFALCILVAAVIPALRKFEKRWKNLSDEQAVDPSFAPAYKRDLTLLWVAAIGLPVALTFIFRAAAG